MTKYEDMCTAAKTAKDEFFAYRQRCWNYFGSVVEGLQMHCGVPSETITYLKWNGQQGDARSYSPPSDSPTARYTLPGAINYDEADGFWHLGLNINLSPNAYPVRHISFLLCANEQNGIPMMRMGLDEKPQMVPFEHVIARDMFCDRLMERLTQVFREPIKPATKKIGFLLGTLRPDDSDVLTQAMVQETTLNP
jgi:hypothetical protein